MVTLGAGKSVTGSVGAYTAPVSTPAVTGYTRYTAPRIIPAATTLTQAEKDKYLKLRDQKDLTEFNQYVTSLGNDKVAQLLKLYPYTPKNQPTFSANTFTPTISKAQLPDGKLSGGTINITDGVQTTAQLAKRPIIVEYQTLPNQITYDKLTGQILPNGTTASNLDGPNTGLAVRGVGAQDITNTAKTANATIANNAKLLADALDVLYPKDDRPTDIQVTKQKVATNLATGAFGLPAVHPQSNTLPVVNLNQGSSGAYTPPASNKPVSEDISYLPTIVKQVEPLVAKIQQIGYNGVVEDPNALAKTGDIQVVVPKELTPKSEQQIQQEIAEKQAQDKNLKDIELQKLAAEEEAKRTKEAAENQKKIDAANKLAQDESLKREQEAIAAEASRLRSKNQSEYDISLENALKSAEGNTALAQTQLRDFDARQRGLDAEKMASKQATRTNPAGFAGGFAQQAIETKAGPVSKAPEGLPNVTPRRQRQPIVPANKPSDLLPSIDGLQFGGN